MILQVSAPIVANQLTTTLEVEHDKSRNPVDSVALLQILDALVVSVGYREEGHGGKVPLEGCLIPIIRAEHELHTLRCANVNLLIELCECGGEEATRGCPVRAEVYTHEVRGSVLCDVIG